MNEEAMKLGAAAIARVVRLARYYEWAYGNLAEADSEIGILGEYVVGAALKCLPRRRSVTGEYDLTMKDGTTIEVKTTSRKHHLGKSGLSRWRWQIYDQKRALEGRSKIADRWVFVKVEFPEGATKSRLFNPFDERWFTCYVISGETLLATGVKSFVSDSTLKRCAAVCCKPSELRDYLP